MKIEPTKITVAELAKGYTDNKEGGVTGFSGKLDIRPPYQREFVYKDKQRGSVIDTVMKGFPLNVMYWAVRPDGTFEIIDGQQRTISICQYMNGYFSFNNLYIQNLQDDQRQKFKDYELTIYLCSGTDTERLDWFRTINIAGEQLTDQELRNAVYSGSWVTDAKRYFSRTAGPAYGLGGKYLDGTPIRQDYLETIINWISGGNIEDYMAKHQHDLDAKNEWEYFQKIIDWIDKNFIVYRKEMKGIPWGILYKELKNSQFNQIKLENEISQLMEDEEVTNKKGIYAYVLNRNERNLNIRIFSPNQKREVFERQKGKCAKCKKDFKIEEMEADHVTPWSEGGRTEASNCQMLCKEDNRRKGAR
jgi:hypothetical protein